MNDVLAVIMAGGRGERLSILALERAKPALPFAGKYRVIDFTLSNCVNSGIYNVAVLTQYEPLSLTDHIGIGISWGLVPPDRGIRLLQPYLAREEGHDWYKGTADAVYQNLPYINEQGAELVLILSGDHIYKMDYSDMLKFHEEKQADVTLAVTPFPDEELQHFGTVVINEWGQVTTFQEKVKKPQSNLVSMGVYIFKKDILQAWLEEDATSKTSKHDFGKNIFPKILDKNRIFAYSFDGYWHDVGTVQVYWQTSMDLLEMSPDFLLSAEWPIRTKEVEGAPTMVFQSGDVIKSLISNGCAIEGRVERSVLSPGVRIAEGAVVKDSVILSDSIIGKNSVIDHSIIDKEVVIESDCCIGFGDDFRVNRREPKVLNYGITIVGKRAKIRSGVKIGRNCVIYGGVGEDDFPHSEIQSGETIRPRRRHTPRKA
ncbi:glucose-1-phosphate adenylyltransferase subunit GlgD [Chloroflexota bacterium]